MNSTGSEGANFDAGIGFGLPAYCSCFGVDMTDLLKKVITVDDPTSKNYFIIMDCKWWMLNSLLPAAPAAGSAAAGSAAGGSAAAGSAG